PSQRHSTTAPRRRCRLAPLDPRILYQGRHDLRQPRPARPSARVVAWPATAPLQWRKFAAGKGPPRGGAPARRPAAGPRATGYVGGAAGGSPRDQSTARNTSDALVPPKPNEFDSTVLISRFLDLCGTRSIAVSTDGLSRLIVGGATSSRMASTEK